MHIKGYSDDATDINKILAAAHVSEYLIIQIVTKMVSIHSNVKFYWF